MEPLFFKAENQDAKRQRLPRAGASMEPLFFKAENSQTEPEGEIAFEPLQWSRFFSKRKILVVIDEAHLVSHASMEPLFFKAENLPTPASRLST